MDRQEEAGVTKPGPIYINPDPLQRVGGYDLHLYCKYTTDTFKHTDGKFWHDKDMHPEELVMWDNKAQAERYARRKGWILHKDGTSTCPHCAKRIAAGEKPLPPKEKT